MAEMENTGFFLRSPSAGERYTLGPPSQSDFAPWDEESNRYGFDYLAALTRTLQAAVQLGRALRNVNGHDAERRRCADTIVNAQKLIDARLASWRPQNKGN